MSANPSIGGVVLCGGKSQRMGRPKHLLPFGRECLLQRVVGVVQGVVDEVCVVAAEEQELPSMGEEVLVRTDQQPDLGPLSGLATGLATMSHHDAVFVSSCDAPFLCSSYIEGLLHHLGTHEIVIVQGDRHFHPLAAVYRTRILFRLEALLTAGRLRPIFLLEECDAMVVAEEVMRKFDPELRSLQNVNTPGQYAAALREAGLPQPAFDFDDA